MVTTGGLVTAGTVAAPLVVITGSGIIIYKQIEAWAPGGSQSHGEWQTINPANIKNTKFFDGNGTYNTFNNSTRLGSRLT